MLSGAAFWLIAIIVAYFAMKAERMWDKYTKDNN